MIPKETKQLNMAFLPYETQLLDLHVANRRKKKADSIAIAYYLDFVLLITIRVRTIKYEKRDIFQ